MKLTPFEMYRAQMIRKSSGIVIQDRKVLGCQLFRSPTYLFEHSWFGTLKNRTSQQVPAQFEWVQLERWYHQDFSHLAFLVSNDRQHFADWDGSFLCNYFQLSLNEPVDSPIYDDWASQMWESMYQLGPCGGLKTGDIIHTQQQNLGLVVDSNLPSEKWTSVWVPLYKNGQYFDENNNLVDPKGNLIQNRAMRYPAPNFLVA